MVRYLNKTKIEWCDFTWNPVTGCYHWRESEYCRVGKDCYAKNIAERFAGTKAFPNGFEYAFYPERLSAPSKEKEPSKIFVCSMGDLFGNWVPYGDIKKVIQVVKNNSKHIFQFLTKNPGRMLDFDFPPNAWCGTTINTKYDLYRLRDLNRVKAQVRFISFEPLMDDMGDMDLTGIQWIIIGGQTGRHPIHPNENWVNHIIINCLADGVDVFLKDNIEWPVKWKDYPKV